MYPVNPEDGLQHGTCINRWYDKLQLIVTSSGNAGVSFEHSAVDGHTVLRFASDVFTDTVVRFAQTISGRRVHPFFDNNSRNGLSDSDECVLDKDSPSNHRIPNNRRPETRPVRYTSPLFLYSISVFLPFLFVVLAAFGIGTESIHLISDSVC